MDTNALIDSMMPMLRGMIAMMPENKRPSEESIADSLADLRGQSVQEIMERGFQQMTPELLELSTSMSHAVSSGNADTVAASMAGLLQHVSNVDTSAEIDNKVALDVATTLTSDSKMKSDLLEIGNVDPSIGQSMMWMSRLGPVAKQFGLDVHVLNHRICQLAEDMTRDDIKAMDESARLQYAHDKFCEALTDEEAGDEYMCKLPANDVMNELWYFFNGFREPWSIDSDTINELLGTLSREFDDDDDMV